MSTVGLPPPSGFLIVINMRRKLYRIACFVVFDSNIAIELPLYAIVNT